MYNVMFYFFALLVIIFIIFVTRRLDDSKSGVPGRRYVRTKPPRVAPGNPIVRMKLLAFAVGASFAG
jgi:branched-chain amino acid transport system permease protein